MVLAQRMDGKATVIILLILHTCLQVGTLNVILSGTKKVGLLVFGQHKK